MGACPIFPRYYSQPPTLLCILENMITCSSTRKPHTLYTENIPTAFQTSPLLFHSSSSCIRKNATPKVTPTRRYLLPRTIYKIRQGTRVDDLWLTRLQPIAMYVVVTTVGSGLVIVNLNTYANSVVVAFSVVVALNNKVGLGCFFEARFENFLSLFLPGAYNRLGPSGSCIPKSATHKVTTARRIY